MRNVWLNFSLLMLLLFAASAASPEVSVSPELSVRQRIDSRAFPSVFQAWSDAAAISGETLDATRARHDLIFNSPGFFGLRWNDSFEGQATGFAPDCLLPARARRQDLLRRNPHLVLLLEIRYRDAGDWFLPADHRWWKRDRNGAREIGWPEGGYYKLDFAGEEYQNQVAAQARAAIKSGVVDGVMLDWWEDDAAHIALIQKVRAAVGPNALILVNANDRQIPQSAPYVNGLFMESYRSKTVADWTRIADTLAWAEKNLRSPRINCLETWYQNSRRDFNRMRATTCLSLTLSNGYCLFSDPNDLPTPDHQHDWYAFWDAKLGRPAAAGRQRPDGAFFRPFTHGVAVYNPMSNAPVTVTFSKARRSAATGQTSKSHVVPALDGGIYLDP